MSEKPLPGDSPLLPPKPDRLSSQLHPTPDEDGLPPRRPGKPFDDFTSDCHHTRITRIWDPEKKLRCSICKQPTPFISWLWRCVVDTDGQLPKSDFDPTEPAEKCHTTFIPASHNMDPIVGDLDPAVISFIMERGGNYSFEEINTVPHLKPWILKGIAAGDYTHDQVKLFCKQLNQVQKAIRSDLARSANGGRAESAAIPAFNGPHRVDADISRILGHPTALPDMCALTGRASQVPDISVLTGRPSSTPDTRPSTATSNYLNSHASANTRPSTASSGAGSSNFTRNPTFPTSTTISTLDNNVIPEEVRLAYEWDNLHQEHAHFMSEQHRRDDNGYEFEEPDRRLPVSLQNLLRFDHLSTPPGLELAAEGFVFPQLPQEYNENEANASVPKTYEYHNKVGNQTVISQPHETCQFMACSKCWPRSDKIMDRLDSIDDVLNGPMPPMHELMVGYRRFNSFFSMLTLSESSCL